MTAPNHIVGGFVITGLLGSFFNLNILASPIYIASTIVGALIPDIDYTKSMIGKIFRPISKYLNRRFGHRTITHSLLAMLGSFLFCAFVESTFYHQTTISKIYLLGFFSHLILDMMTVQGVPLFYPFLRNPCVLPGNPNARFKTGNLQSETLIFCFFCVSIIFLQPLFKNGFWTQYNRYFGTPKHLASEFHKSNQALNVHYIIKRGTEIIKGEGICISAKESEIVLLEKNDFHILDKNKYAILEVKPEHTNQKLLFEEIHFFEISIDSLNTLVNQNPIQLLEVHSSQEFEILNNNVFTKMKNTTIQYPSNIFFKEVLQENLTPIFSFSPNPKIKTYESQINFISQSSELEQILFHQKQAELKILQQEFYKEKNTTQKEALFEKIKLLQKELQQFPIAEKSFEKTLDLKQKIRELQQLDYIKFQKEKLDFEKEILLQKNQPTRFTGNITYVVLKDKFN